MDEDLSLLARELGARLRERKLMLVTAESCTGGWIAQVMTSLPGSSHWFERGFVTYTNAAKREMLGVGAETLQRWGAVSEEVVREMAAGALRHSTAQVSLAVSGIAGPGGEVPGKPVGTVCLGWSVLDLAPVSRTDHYSGDRTAVRRQAVAAALQGAMELLERWHPDGPGRD